MPGGRAAAGFARDRGAGGKSGLHGKTVPVKDRRAQAQGKCHREQTATAPQGPAARVKRWGKGPPRFQQWRRHGKPHREQGRIGRAGSAMAQGFPPRPPGWPREARGDAGSRGMVAQAPRGAGQNPAYRPPGTTISLPFIQLRIARPQRHAIPSSFPVAWRPQRSRRRHAALSVNFMFLAQVVGMACFLSLPFPRRESIIPCSPILSHVEPCQPGWNQFSLGGAGGSAGLVGRADGVGGPRRPLLPSPSGRRADRSGPRG